MANRIITPVDFETHGIKKRPDYPPVPVGVAVKIDGKRQYLAWGHPQENNTTKEKAKRILTDIFRNHAPLFHNGGFDIAVGMKHLGLPMPAVWHDTLFLAYLYDPRFESLSLKPLADHIFGMSAKEQDKLKEWILKNVPGAHDHKGGNVKRPDLFWGANIHLAPGKLVGKYAIGDIYRTEKLFNYFYPYILERGMYEAYSRERDVMPIFEFDMSDQGIAVAGNKLKRDKREWLKQIDNWDKWIRRRLGNKDLNIDSNNQLADALDKSGKVSHWIKTDKGNRSTARDNIKKVCTDQKLLDILEVRGVLTKYISTFANAWIESADKNDGRIYPNFNQVRTPDEHGKVFGTRSGRPSSNDPNFLNVPRNQENPLLPNLRNYIVPDDGCSFLLRDYSQQEFRITGHFEQGALFHAYKTDPTTDAHKLLQSLILQLLGVEVKRLPAKTINFGKIYGMGKPGVANKLNKSVEEVAELIKAHAKAFPDVIQLDKNIKLHTKQGYPIYTWGGREYYAEEPTIVDGRWREWFYKMLNYLIQGSAADITKEAMLRVKHAMPYDYRLTLQVYDEIVGNAPKGKEDRYMRIKREAMESIELDVPLLSDGKIGKLSWGQAKKCKI